MPAAPVLVMVSSEEEESDSSETEKEDDEGIVFVARATDEVLQGKTTPGRHQCSMLGQLPLGSLSFLCLWSRCLGLGKNGQQSMNGRITVLWRHGRASLCPASLGQHVV